MLPVMFAALLLYYLFFCWKEKFTVICPMSMSRKVIKEVLKGGNQKKFLTGTLYI